MMIKVRARYVAKPKTGIIRIANIIKNQPILYKLQLFDESLGIIRLTKNEFTNMESAIAHASLYGFVSSSWQIEEKEV